MKLFEGPIIIEPFKSPLDFQGWIKHDQSLPHDIEEQIASYNLHHPILAHHKTCKCYRCCK